MSVSLDGTSKAPTNALMAPMFGTVADCEDMFFIYARLLLLADCRLQRRCLFGNSCALRRRLLLPAMCGSLDRAGTFPERRAVVKHFCFGWRNPSNRAA